MKEWIKSVLRLFRLYGAASKIYALAKSHSPSAFVRDLSFALSSYRFNAGKIDSPLLEEIQRTYRRYLLRDPSALEKRESLVRFRRACGSAGEAHRVIRTGSIRCYLGIRPLNVEMDITNHCNLRCRMCHFSFMKVEPGDRRDLSLETYTGIAEQLFPLANSLSLSLAAEPLVNREFIRLAALAKTYRVPLLYMTTNGLLLDKEIIAYMVRNRFGAVHVSIDGASKDTYERIRRGASFDALIRNVKALVRCKAQHGASRPEVNFVFVMMGSNIHELPSLIDLAAELGIDKVHATHLVPYAPLANESESLVHDQALCNRMLADARRKAGERGIILQDPGDFVRSAPAAEAPPRPAKAARESALLEAKRAADRFAFNKRFLDKDKGHRACLFPWHFVGIDAAGDVHPCGWHYHEPPMGNIHAQSFEEIWSGRPYRQLRSNLERGLLKGNCSTCPAAGMGALSNPRSFAVQYPLGGGNL